MHSFKTYEMAYQCEVTDSEAARLVTLCADLINAAAKEAFREIDRLSCAILDSARHADALLAACKDRNPEAGPAKTESRALQETMRSATMHLQFGDRLQQRLSNISTNLAGLAKLMQSIDLPITDSEWGACLDATRATFTMEQERRMFDAMFGAALPTAHPEPDTGASQGPILFDGEAGNERG